MIKLKNSLSYIKNSSGATAVEFALVATVFLTLVFGIMEAGRIMWIQNALQYSVDNAGRLALVDADLGVSEVETAARNSLQDMWVAPGGLSATINEVQINGIDYLQIDATYQYSGIITALLPSSLDNFSLSAYTRRPMVWRN